MSKAVKKIASLAAAAWGAYSLYSTFAAPGVSPFQSTAFWKGTGAGKSGGLGGLLSKVGGAEVASSVGLGLQGISGIKQAQYRDEMQEAEEEKARKLEKINEREAQKTRIAAYRENLLKKGRMESNIAQAGVVPGGTSIATTAPGALNTQFGTQVANVEGAVGQQRSLGQSQTDFYNAYGNQQQWADISSMGKDIFRERQFIGSIFS